MGEKFGRKSGIINVCRFHPLESRSSFLHRPLFAKVELVHVDQNAGRKRHRRGEKKCQNSNFHFLSIFGRFLWSIF